MKPLSFILVLLVSLNAFGQTLDSLRIVNLEAITVTAFKEEPARETSLNIIPLRIDSLTRNGTLNLTELLARSPGVGNLSTGVAIAKPVIRGLYGNRILVLLAGLKFDNQQWQEEHGLGLSDIGLSNIELIKGPMSILYGTEAIGGIVNLVEELPPPRYEKVSDFSVKFNSNTLGGLMQAGYKVNHGKSWYRIRLGLENNADYSDGNNNRVLNSRFDGYYLKTTYGFERKKWVSTNYFSSSFNRYGFIFNDIYTFITPDARWSRKLDVNPAHLVLLNIFSSDNKVYLSPNSKLTVNAGIQSNERMENEGGGAISLNMHLLTFQYLVKWEKTINKKHRIIVSNLGSLEDNTNFGARKIVPDAHMQESNLAIYYETNLREKLILENGIGFGEKWIKTYFTASVNGPDKEVQPFNKFSPYYNLFSGLSFNPEGKVNLKFNIATGVRIPNLAELSSNGLHEGIFTYEIGSPALKNEQNVALNFIINVDFEKLSLYITPFYNHFFNYVYLAPTTESWYGFPVFRYKQQDADQAGLEATADYSLTPGIRLSTSFSGMMSKTADRNNTPYIPANKISPDIHWTLPCKHLQHLAVYLNADYCFSQYNTFPGELGTPDYFLLNAGFSGSFSRQKQAFEFSVAGNNLLNTAYYDHLSRFKNYGLLNIGRNISVMLKVKLNQGLDR